jgi:hypothetical protein
LGEKWLALPGTAGAKEDRISVDTRFGSKKVATESVEYAVKTLVSENWSAHKSALLLSALPRLLETRDVRVAAWLNGRKLAQAIEEDLPDAVHLLRNEANMIELGLIPRDIKFELPASRYFRKKNGETSIPSALWRAFTAPLPDEFRRFVTLEPTKFLDVLDSSNLRPPIYEVPRELIVGGSGESRVLVTQNIQSWLQANGLTLEALRSRKSAPQAQPSRDAAQIRALGEALAELDDNDAARILVPLDLVRKLLASGPAHKK